MTDQSADPSATALPYLQATAQPTTPSIAPIAHQKLTLAQAAVLVAPATSAPAHVGACTALHVVGIRVIGRDNPNKD